MITTALICGRIGARYGIVTGLGLFGLLLLYTACATLLDWPSDGTVAWFLEGMVIFALVFSVLGVTFGSISGFVLGFVGALVNRPLGWIGAGILAGATFWCLNVGLLSVFSRKPSLSDLSVTHGLDMVFPLLGYALLGFLVDRAVRTDKPRLWWRDRLQSCLAPRQHEAI